MAAIYVNTSLEMSVTSSANLTRWGDFQDPFVSSMGDYWDIAFGITILIIVITGIFLNVIVLWTLLKLRRKQNHQHQVTNTDYYIIALATSDLLAVVLCYPLTFVSTVSHRWLFGEVGCAINGFFGFLFSTIDVGVLSTMSIVRMLSVKMPHCALVKAPRYTFATLVGVVIYALIWTAAPLFGWGGYAPEPFGTSCTVAWKMPDQSYVTAVFTGVLAVPLLIMLVCYGCVVYHMSVSAARVGRYFVERKRRARRQNRLVRMAVLMCVCFLIIWLPYSVLSICFAYIPDFDVHPVQSAIPTVLAKISHVINPVIYFTMNPTYRRRVKCFFCWKTVASPVSQTTGKTSRDTDDADKSSDQPTRLPLSTYINPSPSVHHTGHDCSVKTQDSTSNIEDTTHDDLSRGAASNNNDDGTDVDEEFDDNTPDSCPPEQNDKCVLLRLQNGGYVNGEHETGQFVADETMGGEALRIASKPESKIERKLTRLLHSKSFDPRQRHGYSDSPMSEGRYCGKTSTSSYTPCVFEGIAIRDNGVSENQILTCPETLSANDVESVASMNNSIVGVRAFKGNVVCNANNNITSGLGLSGNALNLNSEPENDKCVVKILIFDRMASESGVCGLSGADPTCDQNDNQEDFVCLQPGELIHNISDLEQHHQMA